jgi:hypothetical protein
MNSYLCRVRETKLSIRNQYRQITPWPSSRGEGLRLDGRRWKKQYPSLAKSLLYYREGEGDLKRLYSFLT